MVMRKPQAKFGEIGVELRHGYPDHAGIKNNGR